MLLIELFESTPKKKLPPSTPRNFVAKNMIQTGAGSHTDKKFNRKEKHKKPVAESTYVRRSRTE